MRSELYCLPLALLFLASVVPSYGQMDAVAATTTAAPAADGAPAPVEYFDLHRNFSLNCSSLATSGAPLTWEKNGTAIEKWADLKGRVVLLPAAGVEGALLTLGDRVRATDADVGNYTCRAGDAAALHWQLHAKPHAKLPSDTNVVEGQKLKITCKLIGRPYPAVEWFYSDISENMENATAVSAALGDRVSTAASEQGVEGGVLVVEPAQRSDRGWYRCAATGGVGTPAVTQVRVKDMYAALWPFLGICAEVFVLCAIILVYEKRRTKPELDDSDTDNHDQKKS